MRNLNAIGAAVLAIGLAGVGWTLTQGAPVVLSAIAAGVVVIGFAVIVAEYRRKRALEGIGGRGGSASVGSGRAVGGDGGNGSLHGGTGGKASVAGKGSAHGGKGGAAG